MVLLLAGYWGLMGLLRVSDLPISTSFMSSMGASALVMLLFLIWWLSNRAYSFGERLAGALAYIGAFLAAGFLSDKSIGFIGLVFVGVPIVFTAWLGWLQLARHQPAARRTWGTVALLALLWGGFLLARVDGVDGSNRAAVAWRWSPSAEDAYLAELAKAKSDREAANQETPAALELQPGDWPEFRGPKRQGEVHGVIIATDWNASPPKELWRKRIGPAWSSVIVIGNRLYTQEQRGEQEAVVCLDTADGHEIWCHTDATRYSDGQAGAGPRGTPTFADGKIYSLGANGILNCLDAVSGAKQWSRNIITDSSAPLPMWGFSSSPLVADGVVVVYAGGAGEKGLLAYQVADGSPAWTTATGPISYSSPQLASLGDSNQLLFLSDQGLVATEPASGKVLWHYDAAGSGIWRVVQPRQASDGSLLIGSEDLGLVRLDIDHKDETWSAAPRWSSRAIRPAFNDFVISGDHVFGFDESIFCCVDLQTGKRRWKAGRYGHGQVLLLADQPLLIVLTETGEVVLVAANPEKHEEVARLEAIHGKTWNHPVVAHGKLFVRNDEEMACYELPNVSAP